MRITDTLARARLALALALLVGGVAVAGETLRDETRVLARTAGGVVEKLTVPELAVGETRAVATDSGAGALVTRNAGGLRIEVAGETFDVTLPDVAARDADGDPMALAQHLATDSETQTASREQRKVIVIKHADHAAADADGAAGHELGLLDDPESLFAQDGNDKRVMVVRRVVREHTISH